MNKIFTGILSLAAVFTSCINDPGNYDYDWVQSMKIEFADDSLIVSRGSVLNVIPTFVDKKTGEVVTVDYDDYMFTWNCLPVKAIYTRDRIHISDKYDIDTAINMPVQSDYHRMELKAVNKNTGQTYTAFFHMKVIGRYQNTYVFMTEDASQNIDIEFYGKSGSDEVIHVKNYLTEEFPDYPFRAGGARGIGYDKPGNRLFLVTGSGMSWLNTPDFDYNSTTNKLSELLIPQTADTFERIYRLGDTGSATASRTFMFFTASGNLNILNNSASMQPDIAFVETAGVELAPMVAGCNSQSAAIFWDRTNSQFVYASLMNQGIVTMHRMVTPILNLLEYPFVDCLHMGGSLAREMIMVAIDDSGDYWRIDYSATVTGMAPSTIAPVRDNKKLEGTADLGTIRHWLTSLEKGYLYVALDDNTLRTYVEAQTGDMADPGWQPVAITDKNDNPVTIGDPISFMLTENNGADDLRKCFYVFTYSAANGGTLFILKPDDGDNPSPEKAILIEKITGLGNAKRMCYWWG